MVRRVRSQANFGQRYKDSADSYARFVPVNGRRRAQASGPKGRIAIVTDAGWDGMGWTRQRRARNGVAGQAYPVSERPTSVQTNGANADGEVVWSWPPLLTSSWRRRVRLRRENASEALAL
jgi:hypothetical protein